MFIHNNYYNINFIYKTISIAYNLKLIRKI